MGATSWQLLIEGAWTTPWISAIAIAFGVMADPLTALVRMLRLSVIGQLLVVCTNLAHATPPMTLVLSLFLLLPTMGIDFDKSMAVTVALTLNTSTLNAEIWHNAFHTFPREQREVAESVGMRRWTYFHYIMLPQIWIEDLPVLVNEVPFLIKGSSAIAVIGVADLTWVTNRISSVTYEPLSSILAAGLLYMVIIGCLLKLQGITERKARRLAR